MSELREVEYNPFTGETKKWYFDDQNNIVCKKSVDLTKLIDHCKEQEAVVKGFSESKTKFHHVASLPPIVIEKIMKEHNLDVFSDNPADQTKLMKIIETEYPVLKTNSSKLWRPK